MKKHNLSAHTAVMGPGSFFGAVREQLHSGDFTVSAVTHRAARLVPPHAHAHAFLSMLIAGSYREWFGGSHWDARPLGLVLRPADAEHRDEIGGGGASFLCVDIAPAFWASLADAGFRLQRRAFEDRPMSASALRLLRELCDRCPGWRAVAESLVNELAAEYVAETPRGGRGRPRWLRQALDRLREDPACASPQAIAAELGLHPVHVSRTFKRHVGVTVSRYLRELRLQRAARALLESREPLAQLADRHGFADQSHMTRAFAHATHWSPARLRCACDRLS